MVENLTTEATEKSQRTRENKYWFAVGTRIKGNP